MLDSPRWRVAHEAATSAAERRFTKRSASRALPHTAVVIGALVLALGGCGSSAPKEDPSFFTLRAVTATMTPPCAAAAVAELRDGQPVACYELGPPGLDAGDVKSAKVTRDSATTTENVEFSLSRDGAERFNALARAVGVGGQIAIVVDGEIVSVPHLAATEFPGKGLVTGLDTAGAQRLAKRLDRG